MTQDLSKSTGVRRVKAKRRTKNVDSKVTLSRALLSFNDVKTHNTNTTAPVSVLTGTPVYWIVTDPSILVQGVGQQNNYIGSRIRPVGLTVRYALTAGDAYNIMRVGVFQNLGPTTSSPGNYYEDPTRPLTPVKAYPAYPYVCLSDQLYSLALNSDTNTVTRKIFIPGSKLAPLAFIGGGITTGEIVMVVLSDSAATPNPTIQIFTNLRYTDI